MYCVKCGNKVRNNDIYCSKCGNKINREMIQDSNVYQENIETLPINWYKFFTYFRLPIGIALGIFSLASYNYSSFVYNKIALGNFLINIAIIIFAGIALYMLHTKNKESMVFVVIQLIVECISICTNSVYYSNNILSSIISLIFIVIIWFIPNYIYFNKRRKLFVN